MRRVVACAGGETTRLEERPMPSPAPGELLLRLRVVGFCGTDLFKLRSGSAEAGSVLGHELVGTITGVGAGVTDFRGGDRVVVPHHVPCGACVFCLRDNETMCPAFKENLMEPGGFADAILIRERAVRAAAIKIPAAMSDEKAVFVEPAACVLRGIRRSGLGSMGAAIVLGAGSMGLLHLLVLKAIFPLVPVLMVDPDGGRWDVAARLGATAVAMPGQDATEAMRALTQGIGADAVFDTVGGGGTLAAGIALTRPGGSIVLFAHAPQDAPASLDLNTLFKSERRIIATYSGSPTEQRAIFDLLSEGALDPSSLVTHKMPLDDFDAGVALVVKQQALKVLFTPSRGPAA